TAAILAGGRGTRLRPVASDRPKALFEVAGRPFLARMLDQLDAAGIRSAVLCIGHLGDQIRAAFGASYARLRLLYSQESSPAGTGGALSRALPHFNSDPVLVMNGDSYCEVDLADLLAWHQTRGATGTLVLVRAADPERYGSVRVSAEGTIVSFVEKAGGVQGGWVSAGIYLLSLSLLGTLPSRRPLSLEREVFPSWVGRGLYGYRSPGRFLDIGTPQSYAISQEFFVKSSGKAGNRDH
ncbi:MAG: nucleotidyltransferase family protein, partial [Acidobacteria bacterium]|nr:nucleotidyltransferase family protein [Acidobacteriota bacterium]